MSKSLNPDRKKGAEKEVFEAKLAREKSSKKEFEEQVLKGLAMAHKKMIEFKKQKGTPIVISKNGKVIEVYPE